MARFPAGTPAEEMSAALEDARRLSRFKAAEERIKRIVDGMPQLTDEQLAKLAVLLQPHLPRGPLPDPRTDPKVPAFPWTEAERSRQAQRANRPGRTA